VWFSRIIGLFVILFVTLSKFGAKVAAIAFKNKQTNTSQDYSLPAATTSASPLRRGM
jgi:hypothetical protein